MNSLEDNMNDKSNSPLNNSGKNSFDLPLDYFVSFEDKLKQKIELESELAEFSVLSSIKKENVFTSPVNYFQSGINPLSYKAELSGYPRLGTIKKPEFNDLEERYKKQFSASLEYKIELTDELLGYKTLYLINKLQCFIAPENYFETVAERMRDRIYSGKKLHAISVNTILDFIFGKKMAFALGVFFIVSLFIYFNQYSGKIIEPTDCKTLACLEKQEILNTKTISNFDEDQLIDLVDVKSLYKQLNIEKQSQDSVSVNNGVLNEVSTDDLLDEL